MDSHSPVLHRSEVLLLEDDASLRRRLAAALRAFGAEVTEASNLAEARRLATTLRPDFALLDLHLPDGVALDLLRERVLPETTGIVVMTAFGGIDSAVTAMRLGAGDFVTKPFEPEELPVAFARCRQSRNAARRDEHRTAPRGADELFFGFGLQSVKAQLDTLLSAERRLAGRPPPILIEGETGTGKTVLARWLHHQGPRATGPFIAVNCAALPASLVESELFGHERGAFTDARQSRIGLIEAAEGGTLFLDEIASLSLPVQAKLLTALEEGAVRRLGRVREVQVDFRLIAASNLPLRALAESGAFREDLYHRLNLFPITLPPLRDRGADLEALAQHLLERLAARHRVKRPAISASGLQRLRAQPWRGNVRELSHELERALILHGAGPLDFAHLEHAGATTAPDWRHPAWRIPEEGFSLDHVIATLVDEALHATAGNVTAAARRLGVTRDYVRYHLAQRQGSAREDDTASASPRG